MERLLKGVLRAFDMDTLEQGEKKAAAHIRRLMVDARLDIRDYELSETRAEQLKCAAAARKRLDKLQANILLTGSVFGPADTAQLSAELERISASLV